MSSTLKAHTARTVPGKILLCRHSYLGISLVDAPTENFHSSFINRLCKHHFIIITLFPFNYLLALRCATASVLRACEFILNTIKTIDRHKRVSFVMIFGPVVRSKLRFFDASAAFLMCGVVTSVAFQFLLEPPAALLLFVMRVVNILTA